MSCRRLWPFILALLAAAPRPGDEIPVSGRVLDQEGAPLARCQVELSERSTAFLEAEGVLRSTLPGLVDRDATDREGGFHVAAPQAGIFSLTVGCPGRVGMTYQLLPLTEPVELPPVTLTPGTATTLFVEGPEGSRVANAMVTVHPDLSAEVWSRQLFAGWRPVMRRGRSDAAGEVEFLRVQGETLKAQAYGREFSFSRVETVEGEAAGLRLRPGRRARIELRAPEGAAIGAVLISLGAARWPVDVLSEQRHFAWVADPSQPNTLWFETEAGFTARHVLQPATGSFSDTVELRRPRTFAGIVVDDESGEPVAQAVIWRDGRPSDHTRSDLTGSWQLRTSSEGSIVFRVAAAGFLEREVEGSQAAAPVRLIRPSRVRGLIASADDRPVGGAIVSAVPTAAGQLSPEVETDPGGKFSFTHLPPGAYRLDLAGEHRVPRALTLFEVTAGAEDLDLGTLRLAPSAFLEGRILSRDGAAVAEARVAVAGGATASETVSDPNGAFRLDGLAPGIVNIEVGHAGFQDRMLRGLGVPSRHPLEVVLEPSWSLRGTVLGSDHEPVAAARIGFRSTILEAAETEPVTATSDGSGNFVLEDLPSGAGWLTVAADRYPTAEVPVSPGEDAEVVTVLLTRGWTVAGEVLGPDGRSVSGARLTLRKGSREGTIKRAETNRQGEFSISGLGSGEYDVSVRHPQYPELVAAVTVPPGGGLRFVLDEGARAAGRVVDPLGVGIARARAVLTSTEGARGGAEVESDADGRFEFSGMGKGAYRLVVEKEGYAPAIHPGGVVLGDSPIEDLEIELGEGVSVAGTISGLSPGELSSLRISVFNPAGQRRSGRVDAGGTYRVEELGAGQWILRASVSGSSRTLQRPLAIGPDDREVFAELIFEEGLEIGGEVLADGAALAGATVLLQGGQSFGESFRTLSDASGRFTLTGVPGGSYLLTVAGPGGLRYREGVELREDRYRSISLETGSLSGRVLRSGGAAAEARQVLVRAFERGAGPGTVILVTETDGGGEFFLPRLVAGHYRVFIQGLPEPSSAEVRPGVHRDLGDLELEPSQ